MSNVAEGFESQSDRLFCRYLSIAKASAAEVRSQLYAALDQGYISDKDFQTAYALSDQTARQIWGLVRYLKEN